VDKKIKQNIESFTTDEIKQNIKEFCDAKEATIKAITPKIAVNMLSTATTNFYINGSPKEEQHINMKPLKWNHDYGLKCYCGQCTEISAKQTDSKRKPYFINTLNLIFNIIHYLWKKLNG